MLLALLDATDHPRANRYRGLCACGTHAWSVLTKGYVTFVSPEDAHFLSELNWYAQAPKNTRLVYAEAGCSSRGTKRVLHREIIEAGPEDFTDHRDWNGLNNRRENLRRCDHVQN